MFEALEADHGLKVSAVMHDVATYQYELSSSCSTMNRQHACVGPIYRCWCKQNCHCLFRSTASARF